MIIKKKVISTLRSHSHRMHAKLRLAYNQKYINLIKIKIKTKGCTVAQLVRALVCGTRVGGSNPPCCTKKW